MPRSADRFLATAIVCSVGIHLGATLAPYTLQLLRQEPLTLPTTPPPRYPPMLQRGKTTVWLTPPRKKEVPPPPPEIVAQQEPIVTPATMEPQVYEASQLTDSPEPVGAVPLMDFPSSIPSTGSAELTLLIDPEGKVLDISVANSTLAPRALEKALEAFRTTPFRPGTLNGNPVISRIKIVVALHPEE
jgi:TonB family protein